MKNNKRHPRTSSAYRASREREVQHEIKSFLSALVSYPAHFAHQPHLSFQQHLFRLVTANQIAKSEQRRRS